MSALQQCQNQVVKCPTELIELDQIDMCRQSQISGNKLRMVQRHLAMLKKYRRKSGAPLGVLAYVYTCTHFIASIYLRLFRGRL